MALFLTPAPHRKTGVLTNTCSTNGSGARSPLRADPESRGFAILLPLQLPRLGLTRRQCYGPIKRGRPALPSGFTPIRGRPLCPKRARANSVCYCLKLHLRRDALVADVDEQQHHPLLLRQLPSAG